MSTDHTQPPHVQLANLSRGYVVSRALHTVAKLGLANYMSTSPVSVEHLAHLTGTQPELLNRLLRFLSAYGLFNTEEDTYYALTELSKPLRDDDPYSIRDVLCMVDDMWWQAFSQLDTCLKTGKSAFFHQHGDDFFHFLSQSPEKQENFDRGMAKLSSYDDEQICLAYDFSACERLVDLGGGRGGLIKTLSKLYPNLPLTLFDSPAVINQLAPKSFSSQVTLESGNFFSTIPQSKAYIFKGVLHDFNDISMNQILSNCAKQMPKDAMLFIAEQVMPESPEPHPNKTMDIVMMALLSGRQRTLVEWQQSVELSGFTFQNYYATGSVFTLMTFSPKT